MGIRMMLRHCIGSITTLNSDEAKMVPQRLQRAVVLWLQCVLLIEGMLPLATRAGTSYVNITRVMIARATWQSPHQTGLIDLPLYPTTIAPLSIPVTNSDRNLNFWFEEPEDPLNNNITRYFFCSIDNMALEAYSACGEIPTSEYAPFGDRGATREYAVFSRLGEGQHTFFVRAASRPQESGQSTVDACGAITSGTGSDTIYEYCGPPTNYSFLVDVTPPDASIMTYWSPPSGQGGLGSQWTGYSRIGGGFLDYVGALQVFVNENGRAFYRGPPNPAATNSTTFMVKYVANEGNLQQFNCRLDGGEAFRCDAIDALVAQAPAQQTQSPPPRSTGYVQDGQIGLLYVEGIQSNGTTRPVVGAAAGLQTSHHAFSVSAVDAAGNVGAWTPDLSWVIDRDAPLTRIASDGLFGGTSRVSTASKVQIAFDSSNGGVFFECRVQCVDAAPPTATTTAPFQCDQTGVFAPCVSPHVITLDEGLLAQGRRQYVFSVRAVDSANNQGVCITPVDVLTSPAYHQCSSYSWSVDIGVPEVTLLVDVTAAAADALTALREPPAVPSKNFSCSTTTNQTTAEGVCIANHSAVGFVLETPIPSETAFECQLDLPIWFPCGVGGDTRIGSPAHVLPYRTATSLPSGQELFVGLPDGDHFFKVRATNIFGSTGAVVNFTWRSDTTAPVAVLIETPPQLTGDDSGSVAFRYRTLSVEDSSVAFVCSWDNTTYFPCSSNSSGGRRAGEGGIAVVTSVGPSDGDGAIGVGMRTNASWTPWMNHVRPSAGGVRGGGDVEVARCPDGGDGATADAEGVLLATPIAIECRVAITNGSFVGSSSISAMAAGQTLAEPCTLSGGLVCRNTDQDPGAEPCHDYEIRLLCPNSSAANASTVQPLGLVNAVSAVSVYVDGVLCAVGNDWTQSQTFDVPANVQSIAVHATSYGDGSVPAGVLVSVPMLDIASTAAWKCLGARETSAVPDEWLLPDFSDALWANAESQGFYGDAPWEQLYVSNFTPTPTAQSHLSYAQWIWAADDAEELHGRDSSNSTNPHQPLHAFCRLSGISGHSDGFTSVTDAQSAGMTVVQDHTIVEGRNTLYVKAMDAVGNVQVDPSVFGWEVDTTPPQTQLFFTPNNISSVAVPADGAPARINRADAEFRFRDPSAVHASDGQVYNGHVVKPRFLIRLDGELQGGYFCPPGSYLCAGVCRVVPVCDRDVTDGVSLDPANESACVALLQGCEDATATRTSPFVAVNLEAEEHSLEVWAVDTIGNVGPVQSYRWIVDVKAPSTRVSRIATAPRVPTSTAATTTDVASTATPTTRDAFVPLFNFSFAAEIATGEVECVVRYECGVGTQLDTAPSLGGGWQTCSADSSAPVCAARIRHRVRLVGVDNVSTAAALAVVSQLDVLARRAVYPSAPPPQPAEPVRVLTVSPTQHAPFQVVYTGGSPEHPGKRLDVTTVDPTAILALVAASLPLSTLDACATACGARLDCNSVVFVPPKRTAPASCVGLSVDAERTGWTVDHSGATSLARIPGHGLMPATDILYEMTVAQSVDGEDTIAALARQLPMEIAAGFLDARLSTTTATTTLLTTAAVTATMRFRGINGSGLQRASVIDAVGNALAEIDSSTSPGTPWTVDLVAQVGSMDSPEGLEQQVLVQCDDNTSAAVLDAVSTAVTSGTLFSYLLTHHAELYDKWGVHVPLVLSAAAPFSWLNVSFMRAAAVSALFELHADLAALLSEEDVHTVTLDRSTNPSFPDTFFVHASFILGTPATDLAAADATSLAAVLGSLAYRAKLREVFSRWQVSIVPGGATRSVRVVSILPTVLNPTTVTGHTVPDTEPPVVTSVADTRTHAYYTHASSACAADAATSGPQVRCLDDGEYNFFVRGIDVAGNVGGTATYAFQVDSTPPQILWKERPPAVANVVDGATATFDVQSNEVDATGRETATFQCALLQGWVYTTAGDALAPCATLPVSFAVTTNRYTFVVRAIDAAGNVGAMHRHFFAVDGVNPTAQILSGTPPAFTQLPDVVLELNGTEPGTFWCSLEIGDCIINDTCFGGTEVKPGHGNAPYTICPSTVLVQSLPTFVELVGNASSALSLGSPPLLFRFRVIMEDVAGNIQEIPSVAVWTIDTSLPRVAIDNGSKPYALSAEPNASISFTVTDALDDRLSVSIPPTATHPLSTEEYYRAPSVECLVLEGEDAERYANATAETLQTLGGWEPCTSPTAAPVSTGSALFLVRCRDPADNIGNTDSTFWTVDGDPPVLTLRDSGDVAPEVRSWDAQRSVLTAQRGLPAPAAHSPGYASAEIVLADNASAAVDHVTLTKWPNNSVTYAWEAPGPSRRWTVLSVSVLQGGETHTVQTFPLSRTAMHGTLDAVTATTMAVLLGDNGIVSVGDSDDVALLTGAASLRFAVYVEFYPRFSVASPSPAGHVSRLQCCLDHQCTSGCVHCHGSANATDHTAQTICATDCTTPAARTATRCDCASAAGYDNFPPGYTAASVGAIRSNADGVPDVVWENATLTRAWACPEGPHVLGGLRAGRHVFSVRTIDQALRVSSTPLVHVWTIDATPPETGLVQLPPPVVGGAGSAMVRFGATEPLASYTCHDAAGAVPCPALATTSEAGVNFTLAGLAQGEHVLSLRATDIAGNVEHERAGTDVLWVTDTTPPLLELKNVSTSASAIRAYVHVEDGATLQCVLTRTPHTASSDETDVGGQTELSWNGCVLGLNSSCYHLTVTGFTGDNSGVVNGAYRMRVCNSNVSVEDSNSDNTIAPQLVACTLHGQPIYDHTDQQLVLHYSSTVSGWVVQNSNGTILASRQAAVSENVTLPVLGSDAGTHGGTGWIASSRGNANDMVVTCGLCGGQCPNIIAYDALPSGYYSLCVTATDAAGNIGNAVCDANIVVRTAAEQAARALAAQRDHENQECDVRSKEISLAIASAVGFILFVVFLSVHIYQQRRKAAVVLSMQHKAAAVLTSTTGFGDASFEGTDMAPQMMF
eukprot:m.1599255 g.1599255  ORF g.1599255 m.1599255 type:complete len:2969 (+) comp25347_c0_seq4:289-9195(+)